MKFTLAPLALVATMCAPAKSAHVTAPANDGAATLIATERPILARLAVIDPRLAQRVHMDAAEADLGKAALEAILSEDAQAAVVDGRLDLFSFGARERALAKLSVPEMDLAETSSGAIARPRLERELLVRLLDAERARVATEKNLPRSAGDLVRGIVRTWTPAARDAQPARDAWLARRLDDVDASLSAPIPRDEQYDLEDALDPLEKEVVNYTQSMAALTRVRVRLGAQMPAPAISWEIVAHDAEPHTGPLPPPKPSLLVWSRSSRRSLHRRHQRCKSSLNSPKTFAR